MIWRWGLILAFILVPVVESRAGEKFTLPGGDEIEVFGLATGNTIELDGRSLYDRMWMHLPDLLKEFAPAGDFRAHTTIRGVDALAFGWRYSRQRSLNPPNLGAVHFYISDGSGWYTPGSGWRVMFGDCFGAGYPHVPRASEKLTLHLYLKDGGNRLKHVVSKAIDNPRYDGKVLKRTSSPPPKSVTSGPLTVDISAFYTGVALPDIMANRWAHTFVDKAEEATSSIVEMVTGKVTRGRMPDQTFTAIVFTPKMDGKETTNVSHGRLRVKDYLGNEFDWAMMLFRMDTQYVGVGDFQLPVADGNFEYELVLMEKPELSSPAWEGTPPLARGTGGTSPAKGSWRVKAAFDNQADLMRVIRESNLEYLAIAAVDAATSRPLAIRNIDSPWHFKNEVRWNVNLDLGEAGATPAVVMRFAEPVKHTVKFDGVPGLP